MNVKGRIKNEETGGRQGAEGQGREASEMMMELAPLAGMAAESAEARRIGDVMSLLTELGFSF